MMNQEKQQMQMNLAEMEIAVREVTGRMGFARSSAEEKALEVFDARYTTPLVDRDVTIRNARLIEHELSLDREGFILVQHKTACANERDPHIVRDRYLEEMTPFIKDYFKASLVVPYRNSVFVRHAGVSPVAGVKGTSKTVHIDFAPIAAPLLAARENVRQGIPLQSYSRLMVIHAWRALSPPPQDFPLALSDSSSLPESDLNFFEFDYGRGDSSENDGRFWTASPRYSPDHRWYHFPDLQPDELILFKGYDSQQKCYVAHTGFDNRRAFPDARPRESFEARFFVYFD
jgi:hypothetical protein